MLEALNEISPMTIFLTGLAVAILATRSAAWQCIRKLIRKPKLGVVPVPCDSNADDNEPNDAGVQGTLLGESNHPDAVDALPEVPEPVPVPVPAPVPVPVHAGGAGVLLPEAHPLDIPPDPPRLRRPGNRIQIPLTLTQQQLEAPTPPKLRRPLRR